MKLIILTILVVSVVADRLENTYLPPQKAYNSGGNGNFLSTPFKSGYGGSSVSAFNRNGAGISSNFAKNKIQSSQAYNAPQTYNAPQQNYNAPQAYSAKSAEASAKILRFDNDNDGLGTYSYAYETDNGIDVQESGELKSGGSDGPVNSVRGSYTYPGLNGVPITVTYIADENGFQASGEHLPTPPPIPEAILKSLDFIAKSQSVGSHSNYDSGDDDGQYVEAPNRAYLQPKEPSRSYLQPNQPSKAYLQPNQPSKAYLQPNQPSFNSRSGYQY